MRVKLQATIALAVLLVTAGCAGLVPSAPEEGGPAETPGPAEGATPQTAAAPDDGDLGEPEPAFQQPQIERPGPFANYTELYDATIDSVVEIRVERAGGQGQGSGFVYAGEGYLVTNEHVVGDAEEVSVGFATGQWRTGEVVGTDVYTDLAVIEVPSLPEGVEPLPLAEESPEPGQRVAAIGSPFGFEGSITHGIVSGVNRSMPVEAGFSIPDTVQTDAAINPGNSGGPLVDMDGTVLGVNRARTGENIGFAISADVIERVVPSLIQNGSYAHTYVGIQTVPVTASVAEANDLNTTRGVMVAGVLDGGPADGVLQPAEREVGPDGQPSYVGGDVIVSVEGTPIESQHALARHLLLDTRPGEEIQVTVLRDGERVTETLTLDQRPDPGTDQGV